MPEAEEGEEEGGLQKVKTVRQGAPGWVVTFGDMIAGARPVSSGPRRERRGSRFRTLEGDDDNGEVQSVSVIGGGDIHERRLRGGSLLTGRVSRRCVH